MLPGASRARSAARRTVALGGAWIALVALLALRWERVWGAVRRGSLDERLAVMALVAALAGCWWLGNRRVRGTAARVGRPESSAWPALARRFRGHRLATLGLVILSAMGLVAVLAPLLAPFDPDLIDLGTRRLLAPSMGHPMGTDDLGRDVFSRVLYGARVSLSIGFLAVFLAITLGATVGAVAGYVGRWLDTVLMRVVDLFLSFPRIVLLVAVVAVVDPSIPIIVLLLGLTGWMEVSRLVRGQVLSLREREFVQAARALGFRPRRILFRHVLPNALTPVIVAATLGIGNAILAEAALSYLGLGVQPPTASWGNIIQSGGDRILEAWWITAFPGLAIVLTVMSFNLVGDGLRDALDPRHTE